jgi:hypothetical protein
MTVGGRGKGCRGEEKFRSRALIGGFPLPPRGRNVRQVDGPAEAGLIVLGLIRAATENDWGNHPHNIGQERKSKNNT